MSSDTSERLTDSEHEALSARGLAFYEATLRPLLEPDHEGEFVAIHVGSQGYAIGKSSGDAIRAARQRHPVGPLVVLQIGSTPEWGLAARLLLGRRNGSNFCSSTWHTYRNDW